MKKQTTEEASTSRPFWTTLEAWAREKMQAWVQQLLEEEVTEYLGRKKSARRAPVEARPGYRNGYGKPRRVTLSSGTITVRRPRPRGLGERRVSRVWPLFKGRPAEVGRLVPELSLHGLAEGDVDRALRGLLGDDAPRSASSVARLKEGWHAEYEAWRTRSLVAVEPVYLWVDGIYVKAGLEREKAAMLVVIAGLRDGRKVVLAVEGGARESTDSWSAILRNLKHRGLAAPRLVIGDGHLGIWGVLANVFPTAREQRCWNHRILNGLDKRPKTAHAQAKPLLTKISYAATREEAERLKAAFARWCDTRGYREAARVLHADGDRMVTFYAFPKAHWKHLRTTNSIGSPFAAVRLRTSAATRFKKVDRAPAVIWKTLLIAEQHFRRLDAPELLAEVAEGALYVNGVRVTKREEEAAARSRLHTY